MAEEGPGAGAVALHAAPGTPTPSTPLASPSSLSGTPLWRRVVRRRPRQDLRVLGEGSTGDSTGGSTTVSRVKPKLAAGNSRQRALPLAAQPKSPSTLASASSLFPAHRTSTSLTWTSSAGSASSRPTGACVRGQGRVGLWLLVATAAAPAAGSSQTGHIPPLLLSTAGPRRARATRRCARALRCGCGAASSRRSTRRARALQEGVL